jgi:hypothetical protein
MDNPLCGERLHQRFCRATSDVDYLTGRHDSLMHSMNIVSSHALLGRSISAVGC